MSEPEFHRDRREHGGASQRLDDDKLAELAEDERVEAGLGQLQHGDATALYDAIYLGSERLASTKGDAGRRRVMVLITDGENTTHHGSYDLALEEAQKTGTMIYSLIVVPVAADAGRDTGGEHALMLEVEPLLCAMFPVHFHIGALGDAGRAPEVAVDLERRVGVEQVGQRRASEQGRHVGMC